MRHRRVWIWLVPAALTLALAALWLIAPRHEPVVETRTDNAPSPSPVTLPETPAAAVEQPSEPASQPDLMSGDAGLASPAQQVQQTPTPRGTPPPIEQRSSEDLARAGLLAQDPARVSNSELSKAGEEFARRRAALHR